MGFNSGFKTLNGYVTVLCYPMISETASHLLRFHIQFELRSKYSVSVIKVSNLMLYGEMIVF